MDDLPLDVIKAAPEIRRGRRKDMIGDQVPVFKESYPLLAKRRYVVGVSTARISGRKIHARCWFPAPPPPPRSESHSCRASQPGN